MCQVIPLISQAAVSADELDEMFDMFADDGVITPDELVQLDQKVDENKLTSTRAELAYSWGMAVLKGGIDGKRARELELENTRFKDWPGAA